MILNRRGLNLMALALMSGALPQTSVTEPPPERRKPIQPPYFPKREPPPPPQREPPPPPPPTPEQIKAQAKRERKAARYARETTNDE